MKWTLDVDFKPPTVTEGTSRITTLATQSAWTHLGLSRRADGTLNVDTDWQYATLAEVFTKVQALAQLSGFVGATIKYVTGEVGETS